MYIMKQNGKSKKGFTLAELLIVIAIIAILVAIMFPVFGAQLDKARAAAELSNVRARYSELVADQLLDGDDLTDLTTDITITKTQLEEALKYPDDTDVIVDDDFKTVTVQYKTDYTGTFDVDEDVTLSGE